MSLTLSICWQEFVSLHGPAVLLLDDVQHFDTASWRLLAAVAGVAAGTLFVAAALRPRRPGTTSAVAGVESVASCVRHCTQVSSSSGDQRRCRNRSGQVRFKVDADL